MTKDVTTLYLLLPAHAKAVRGVAMDALTMEVYTGSADGTVEVLRGE